MPRIAAQKSPPTCSIIEWIGSQLDERLASLPDDAARWAELCRIWNVWNQKYGRFVAAGVMAGDLPREFYFGPHAGWITATDFVVILTDIDARKIKIERSASNDLPTIQSPRLVTVGDHTPERANV